MAQLANIAVVGVLIEVPVMLLVVKVVNSSKGWYEGQGATNTTEQKPRRA